MENLNLHSWQGYPRNYYRSWEFANISIGAETLYFRLLAATDDGRNYSGEVHTILDDLFSHRKHKKEVSKTKIRKWLDELIESQIVIPYEVDGKNYVHIPSANKIYKNDRPKKLRFPAMNEDSGRLLESSRNPTGIHPESIHPTPYHRHPTSNPRHQHQHRSDGDADADDLGDTSLAKVEPSDPLYFTDAIPDEELVASEIVRKLDLKVDHSTRLEIERFVADAGKDDALTYLARAKDKGGVHIAKYARECWSNDACRTLAESIVNSGVAG